MLKVTGTFLDEISFDIPHHNWGRKEWKKDFESMQAIGIDTVILIRCGMKHFLAYPSKVLMKQAGCYEPETDVVEMFLDIADEMNMNFFFGTYDAFGIIPFERSVEINKDVIKEAYDLYGHHKSFKGWYLATEISRRKLGAAEAYAEHGMLAKSLSNNLPVLISPFIANLQSHDDPELARQEQIAHEKDWRSILSTIQGAVDIVAFQDGHIPIHELENYLNINGRLIREYGMQYWTNCETFDRDMPIHFFPIKWEKMYHKLRIAERTGAEKAITFEFSHFMSPNSAYIQAHGLYDRYREYAGLKERD